MGFGRRVRVDGITLDYDSLGRLYVKSIGPLLDGVYLVEDANGKATIKDSSIDTVKIADGAVTTPKIADESITFLKLADDARLKYKDIVRGSGQLDEYSTITLASVTVNANEFKRFYFVIANVSGAGGSDVNDYAVSFQGRLVRDGSVVLKRSVSTPSGSETGGGCTLLWVETDVSNTHTFSVQAYMGVNRYTNSVAGDILIFGI